MVHIFPAAQHCSAGVGWTAQVDPGNVWIRCDGGFFIVTELMGENNVVLVMTVDIGGGREDVITVRERDNHP
eukprot:gene10980-biopygen3537